MRQNRSITSSKSQRNKNLEINSLTSSLFDKIDDLSFQAQTVKSKPSIRRTTNFTMSQFDDLQTIKLENPAKPIQKSQPVSILQKAKKITNQNKNKIQKAKMVYKKSNPQNQGMFLTGCGLYKVQQHQITHNQDYQSVDMNDALKYLVSHQKDDLQQLRKIIKKTSFNIKEYSLQVNKTKNQIVSAADLFGKQLTTDLRMKINKHKLLSNDFCQFQEIIPKRKISTGTCQRQKKLY